jgi:hypothetical protein
MITVTLVTRLMNASIALPPQLFLVSLTPCRFTNLLLKTGEKLFLHGLILFNRFEINREVVARENIAREG